MTQDNKVLATKVKHLEDKVKEHDRDIDKMKDDIGDLKTNHGEQKAYVTQIFKMLDDIKTQLTILRDRDDKLRESNENTKSSSQEKWTAFFEKIAYLAIGAIVTYLLSKI